MIDLNEKKYENKEVKIFNNGEAGVVKDCTVRIEKKGPDDAENAPAYKLMVTEDTGAEINKGYFKNNLDDMSEKQEAFFVKEMKHLAKVFRVELPGQVASYDELIDTTMKLCKKNEAKVKVNVAICYGSVGHPKKYLEIDGFWGIQNVDDNMPKLSLKALKVRPEPDGDIVVTGKSDAGSEDTGW